MLKLERARQQATIKRMDATHTEVAMTTQALMEVLADPAFVALLRAHSLTLIPKLVHQRLVEAR